MSTTAPKLPDVSDDLRAAIVGKSGAGKGEEAKLWLGRQSRLGKRVAMFDVEDEHSKLGTARTGRVRLGSLKQRVLSDALDAEQHLDRADLSLSVVPPNDPTAAAFAFVDFAELVMSTGNMLVGADEIGFFAFGSHKGATEAQKALVTLATTGRKRGLPLLMISQRFMHMPKSARDQVNALQMFLQTDTDDLGGLAKLTNDKSLPSRVSSQRKGESVLWLDPMLRDAA